MYFEICHRTIYSYAADVSLSYHLARLTPRNVPRQRLESHAITTLPAAAMRRPHTDHFGNAITFLSFEGAHRELEITSESTVEILPLDSAEPAKTPAWEVIRDSCAAESDEAPLDAVELAFASPLAPRREEFLSYAETSFLSQRPILEGAMELMERIHSEFQFDASATTVATPVWEFFRVQRGVCQDFAHLMIGCLRSRGLPARYVSGYLETLPPKGGEKLVGADASHAWVALWCGDEVGWIDLDPTNNLIPSDRHITTAWGRDFGDVSPLRGVIVGSGEHTLKVAVDVRPME